MASHAVVASYDRTRALPPLLGMGRMGIRWMTELLTDHLMNRIEALERRVAELEGRTWMLQPVGGLSSPTVDFGTLQIMEEQIEKARANERNP